MLAVGGTALTALTATLVVGAASPASAACGRSNVNTGHQGPGTVVTKPSGTTCHDLNLTKAHDTSGFGVDAYAGFLFHSSTGTWQACSSGYHSHADFTASSSSQWVVLCTDVSVGTRMSVGSALDAPDQVGIAY
jgi:hypothetical protein